MMDDAAIRNEVWDTVQTLNRLWTVEGKPEELASFFHKNMIAISPADRERIVGGAVCVAGWKSFCDAAEIHYWHEIDPDIRIFNEGKTAIVTYYFDMAFTMGGKRIESGGRDMFTLVNEGGKWQAVADQFSPYPAR